MNENFEEEMGEFEEQIADQVGYTGKGENSRHRRSLLDSRPRKKTVILGAAIVVLLIVVIALMSGGNNELSTGDLTSIRVRVDQLEKNLTRLKGMEARIAFLEKQEQGLLQSMEEADRSGRSLAQQLNELSQKIDQSEKRTAPAPAKTKVLYPIQRKPFPLGEGRYHEIRPGDTLYRIGQQYGISVEELCRLNNMTREQVIFVGQKLLVGPEGDQ